MRNPRITQHAIQRLIERVDGAVTPAEVGGQRLMNAIAGLSSEDRRTLKRLLAQTADGLEAQHQAPRTPCGARLSNAAHAI